MFCVVSTGVLQTTTGLLVYLSPLRFSISSTAPGPLGPSISNMMHPCCGLHHVPDFFAFYGQDCPSLRAYTPRMLSPTDMTVDSRDSPSMVSIHLRQSKNDPFGEGVTIHLGRTGQVICPVTAILAYMAKRGVAPGPLFLFQDGSPLSKQRLVHCLRQALAPHGLDSPLLTGQFPDWGGNNCGPGWLTRLYYSDSWPVALFCIPEVHPYTKSSTRCNVLPAPGNWTCTLADLSVQP